MFTVCPKCALTLVVTAADLRAAQGFVRCGRCSNIFNAITALVDEGGGDKPPASPPSPPSEPPPEPAPALAPAPEPQPQKAPGAELEFDPAATNVADIFIEPEIKDREATGTFEAIVLETGEPDPAGSNEPLPAATGAPIPAEPADEEAEEIEEELRSLVQRLEAKEAATEETAAAAGTTTATTRTTSTLISPNTDSEWEEETQTGARWPWIAAVIVLGIALAMQVLHHYRNELAVHPQLNGPLTKIYAALGLALEPRWDVRAYEVHQLGADAANAGQGQLIVRASVKNSAPHPQPLPLLRVAVLDRFGNRIAARDVPPEAYLPRGVATNTPLRAGQRIDAQVSFVDPGSDAVGFEIDACLASQGGSVVCANSSTR